MSIFLYRRLTNTMQSLNLDHDTCVGLASHAPPSLLSKDIQAWGSEAEHDERLKINAVMMLIALEL